MRRRQRNDVRPPDVDAVRGDTGGDDGAVGNRLNRDVQTGILKIVQVVRVEGQRRSVDRKRRQPYGGSSACTGRGHCASESGADEGQRTGSVHSEDTWADCFKRTCRDANGRPNRGSGTGRIVSGNRFGPPWRFVRGGRTERWYHSPSKGHRTERPHHGV